MSAKPARARPKAPESPGDRLRKAILDAFELNAAELVLLDQAAEMADALDRINAEVAERSLTDSGSTGQPVPGVLLAAQRQHAETLVRLIEALRLPAVGEEEGRASASERARRAALVRWSRERSAG